MDDICVETRWSGHKVSTPILNGGADELNLTFISCVSTSAARYQSGTVKLVHQRLIPRQHTLLSDRQRVRLVGTARSFSWTPQRPASLPPQQEKVTSHVTVPSPIPQPRKQKVDLKPGPVKTKSSDTSSSTPSVSSNTTDPSSSSQSNPTETSTTHAETAGGVIETAKHDYDDASQHGILAPAPEGSSRLYTLFHHAKELFVSELPSFRGIMTDSPVSSQKFYFRGLKLIFSNRKRANAMLERARTGGPPLTRWETRYIQTCKVDMLK